MIAYLGIGTNIGDRAENLKNAVDALNLVPNVKVLNVSDVYETDPVGYDNQQDFLNIAVEISTTLSADSLLGAALGIEAGMGRVRMIKNGPRIIDIDVLLYGDDTIDTPNLIIPHPRMFQRGFVIKPLLDLNVKSLHWSEGKTENMSFDGVRFYGEYKNI